MDAVGQLLSDALTGEAAAGRDSAKNDMDPSMGAVYERGQQSIKSSFSGSKSFLAECEEYRFNAARVLELLANFMYGYSKALSNSSYT